MQRYWVKLILEVREYDEEQQRILPQGIKFEPATNLTPEPSEFIRNTLAEHAAKVVTALEEPNATNGMEGEKNG